MRLIALGAGVPLAGATAALVISLVFGFPMGATTMLMVLAGSASYIAVPAAMKLALPEAQPSVYVTLPLAITFPFNLVIGIPLYAWIAKTMV